MKTFIKLGMIGVLAGIFLGGLFKIIEALTGNKVYALLLNVNYLPLLKDWQMNPAIEFYLHMIVSVLLIYMFYFIFKRINYHRRIFPYILAHAVVGIIHFWLTSFSEHTSDLINVMTFTYWLIGHLIYGAIVGWLIILISLKKNP